ncbi:hypothetical protein KCM76_24950 [Zooshikella marina]|uniref:hypothetical protein n=1 Tax=Zooshikella ganghwensis TaxID=202772 RepID=UPI001BB038FC|nr:hypothetical protein [Zooshikella ganghwensis]MBU2709268.1 hypothetical protein [Zooshikella ganghwensis]
MNEIIAKLRDKLKAAQKIELRAIENAQQSFGERERAEFFAAHQALLNAERDLARASNQEFAEPIDFPVEWDIGAPLPFLLQNESHVYLTFYVKEVDPDWNGTYVRVVDAGTKEFSDLALISFENCISTRFGAPNDEVHEGHPLEGKGLESYTAQVVRNSRWIDEIRQINSVHSCYNPESWKRLKHYIFWFHDSTFECIAESFDIKIQKTNMQDLLMKINSELLK